jgi:hypothetical protein
VGKKTHCVEASVFPSGLNAAAMVDLGGGTNGQYLADKCRNDSASTLNHKTNSKCEATNTPTKDKKQHIRYHEIRPRFASLACSVLGEDDEFEFQ